MSVKNDREEDVQIAKGYEFEREHSGLKGEEKIEWTEQVLGVKSLSHSKQQEKRLDTAVRIVKGDFERIRVRHFFIPES